MPTQTPEKEKLLRSTPRNRLRRFQGVLRAFTAIFYSIARLCLAIFVSGSRNSGRGSSLRTSRGIYIRAQLSTGVAVLVLALTIFATVAQPATTSAATADTVNFQAKLMNASGSIAPDGNYNVEFKLYTGATGGSALWTEDWLNNSSQGVRVANGYLTVNLGAHTSFPTNINWAQNLYIGMTVHGTGSNPSFAANTPADGEMTPRLKLTSVPYAFSAGNLSNVSTGGFTSTLNFQGATIGNQNFTIPDIASAGTDTICLYSLGNCAGAGGGITGSGLQNYVAKFDNGTGSHIGNSNIYADGTFVGIGTTSNGGLLSVQGGSTTQNSLFVQGTGSASVATGVIKQATSQTGNLLEFVSSTGEVNASINTAGNVLTLGRIATSGTTLGGAVRLADGTTDGFAVSLISGVLTANSTVTIPNSGGNDTVCLYTLANCVGAGGGITGSGTQNYLTKFNNLGGSTLGNSSLYDNGSFLGLNTTTNNGLLSIQGSGAAQSSLFVQGAASATASTTAIKQATGQTGDLLSFLDTTGSSLGGFKANGSLYYSNSGFTTTLSTATLTANQLISLPNETGTICLQNSTACGFAAATG
ncbi:hypothetical protein H7097_00335, partial [Aeromicrobium sp.]|nr:hypothetical protein [Candidatus Saccharibacteria bacterium]